MGKNVIMIGMPGAGKSTIGVVLAKVLCYEFIDCDLVIQHHAGVRLAELIARSGVESFLLYEDQVNSTIEADNAVISTGGSAVYGENAMRHLKKNGIALYIKLDYESIARRLGDLKERGVALRAGQDLRAAYDERCLLYEKYADITVDANGMSIEQTLAAVVNALRTSGFFE